MADPVAEELRVAVRRILDPRERRASQLRLERGAMQLDERTDVGAAHRRNRRGRARPLPRADASARSRPDRRRCARGLPDGRPRAAPASSAAWQAARASASSEPRESTVTVATSTGTPRRAELGRSRRRVTNRRGAGGRRAGRGVGGRLGEADEQMQQRDRVGAARHGDQNGFAAREHRVAANGAVHLIARAHPATRPGDPPRPRRPRSAPSSRPGRCA